MILGTGSLDGAELERLWARHTVQPGWVERILGRLFGRKKEK